MAFNTCAELIEEFQQGRMVILVDDEDRENEGDLVMAAQTVTPEAINFMTRYARGLICMPMSQEYCERLGLWLMVTENREAQRTKFTVSIDAAKGVSSGISAADRAATIRTAVTEGAGPADFVQPGHIFPLQCEPGGVLSRAGHTEASCDLARMAGYSEAAVVVEILNEDGTMARRPQLEVLAEEHGLKIGTIADLIQHRMLHEKTINRISECALPTRHGVFKLLTYQETVTPSVHFALVRGEIEASRPTLIRVHVQDSLCDLTGSLREDCGWPVSDALARIASEEHGVVVILRHEEKAEDLLARIRNYQLQDQGQELPHYDTPEDLRTYGVGAQILLDLGVRKMRLLSAPKRLHGLSGFDLEVTEYVK